MNFLQKHRVEQASKKFETLWDAKWLATLDASRRRMFLTAIGRMPPSLFLRAVRLAEKIGYGHSR